jgi:peptidyl-prolyl cis-trans isomerase C
MRIRTIATILVLFATVHAAAALADETTVATVNGEALSQGLLDAYSEAMQTQGRNPQGDELLEELVVQEVLVQEAVNEGLDKQSDYIAALEVRRRNLLAQALLKQYLDSHEPSEEALKKIYEQTLVGDAGKEYKARHILLASEADAREAIGELQNGGNFEELAKERSTGPSGPQGGDLGWFAAGSMVPAFGQAVQTMDKGDYSSEPVQTQFGWHVILLEDTRDTEPPPFEEVKAGLKEQAQRQQLQDYVASLRAKAKVE